VKTKIVLCVISLAAAIVLTFAGHRLNQETETAIVSHCTVPLGDVAKAWPKAEFEACRSGSRDDGVYIHICKWTMPKCTILTYSEDGCESWTAYCECEGREVEGCRDSQKDKGREM
jgi:hypothetical protein